MSVIKISFVQILNDIIRKHEIKHVSYVSEIAEDGMNVIGLEIDIDFYLQLSS